MGLFKEMFTCRTNTYQMICETDFKWVFTLPNAAYGWFTAQNSRSHFVKYSFPELPPTLLPVCFSLMTWPMRKKLGFLSPRRVVFRYLGECIIFISTVNKNIIMYLICRNQGKVVIGTSLQARLTKHWKDLFGRLWHLWRHENRLDTVLPGKIQERLVLLWGRGLDRMALEVFSCFLRLFISCFHKRNQFSVWQHKSIWVTSAASWFTSYHPPGTGYTQKKYWDETSQIRFANQVLIWCLTSTKQCFSTLNYTSIFFLPASTISYVQLLLLSDLWWKYQQGESLPSAYVSYPRRFSRKENSCLSSNSG